MCQRWRTQRRSERASNWLRLGKRMVSQLDVAETTRARSLSLASAPNMGAAAVADVVASSKDLPTATKPTSWRTSLLIFSRFRRPELASANKSSQRIFLTKEAPLLSLSRPFRLFVDWKPVSTATVTTTLGPFQLDPQITADAW